MTRYCFALSVLLCSLASLLLIAPAQGQRSDDSASIAAVFATHFAGLFEGAGPYSDLDHHDDLATIGSPVLGSVEPAGPTSVAVARDADSRPSLGAAPESRFVFGGCYDGVCALEICPREMSAGASNERERAGDECPAAGQTGLCGSRAVSGSLDRREAAQVAAPRVERLLAVHDPVYDAAVYGVTVPQAPVQRVENGAIPWWAARSSQQLGVLAQGLAALAVTEWLSLMDAAWLEPRGGPATGGLLAGHRPAWTYEECYQAGPAERRVGAGIRRPEPAHSYGDHRRDLLLDAADALDGLASAASRAARQLRTSAVGGGEIPFSSGMPSFHRIE